jgi:acetylornithine deacetylase
VLDNVPFFTRDVAAFEPLLGAAARAPVDMGFWTEAALLVRAGVDAVVCGPGDIAQAHAADERLPAAELESAVNLFAQALRATA